MKLMLDAASGSNEALLKRLSIIFHYESNVAV